MLDWRTSVPVAVSLLGVGGTVDRPPASAGIGSCPLVSRHFHTLPGVRTPGFCIIRRTTAPGLVLITPRPAGRFTVGEPSAAMAFTSAGRLVWYSQRPYHVHDMAEVRYRRQSLLALFQRTAHGGFYEFRDHRYRTRLRLQMGGGYPTDMHDLQLTPGGTAYLGSHHRVTVPRIGRVLDWVMREIDIATGRVLFEWHASDHVALSASYHPQPADGRPWDFFHGNSIEPPAPGGHTILVSSRNTSSIYGIDRRTGEVRWIFGGKRDQFGLRRHPGWVFCAQHDARRLPNGDLMLFDNGGADTRARMGCGLHAARVPRFRLDVAHRKVRLVRMIRSAASSPRGAGFHPTAVGDARRQPNGDTLISWGTSGFISQVGPGGRVKFAMRVAPWTYRATRANWSGDPGGRPAVAARRRHGGVVDVWASWNGATRIREWRVLAGRARASLHPVGRRFRFAGLETRLRVRSAAAFVAVQALGADHPLGTSRAIRVG
jgi:hypothetical protein